MSTERYHDFREKLVASWDAETSNELNACYLSYFDGLTPEGIEDVRHDMTWQRSGVDKVLRFPSGKAITVEEKVRSADYPDVLLELESVEGKAPGWLYTSHSDWIAYGVKPPGGPLLRLHMLPTRKLRQTWKRNRARWEQKYKKKVARNKDYRTINIPIPLSELLEAMFTVRPKSAR